MINDVWLRVCLYVFMLSHYMNEFVDGWWYKILRRCDWGIQDLKHILFEKMWLRNIGSRNHITKQMIEQNENFGSFLFCSVQLLSRVWLFVTPWTAARQASLSNTNSWSSPKLTSIKSVMPSSHLILCHPFLLLPSIPLSITVFSNESTLLMMWPKYWSFSLSISPSNENPGLVSFRMDWLDLPAVQGTLKSLLQNHSSKAN